MLEITENSVKKLLGVKVIGIGVPTVDAATIVHECPCLIYWILWRKTEQKEFLEEMIAPSLQYVYDTKAMWMKPLNGFLIQFQRG